MTRTADLLAARARLMGPNQSTFYDEPVEIVRGLGVWLWDADGRQYLDCYNNVAHVGHCHPRVVDAIARQAATLNTHTRYLHGAILDYIDRLTATMAPGISQMIMTCTGSEANDIALRMAEAATGRRGIIATDHTYHGNTATVAHLSRTNIPATGDGSHVAHVPAPDSYRGADPATFAAAVQTAIARLNAAGHGLAGIILCPAFVNEGFPDLPPGWLDAALACVRAAGGIVIADEVQPGFGRVGTHFWGHLRAGFAPDVVTMGKPMGNGHPVAGVAARPDIMAAFRSAYRYFNTFGGNPVSVAAATAVLDVIADEGLQANAARMEVAARDGLRALATRHAGIGNVRATGMIFGAEFVTDRVAKTPAPRHAARVVNALRQRGILLSRLGIHANTLKIRPPLPFGPNHLDQLLTELDAVLTLLGDPRD